jgi:adenylate cyclase
MVKPGTARGGYLHKAIAGLAIGLGSATIVLALTSLGGLHGAELMTYDWRMRHSQDPASVGKDIVLVEINDTTIRDLSPAFGRWPWPRVVMAGLVDFLSRAPAKVVAIDVGFWEPQRNITFKLGGDEGPTWTGEDSDAALAASVKKAGNVVLLADAVYSGAEGEQAVKPAEWTSAGYELGPGMPQRPLVIPPFQALTDSARALGHNYLPLDRDGPARRMPPFIQQGSRFMPSIGVAAALMAAGVKPEEVTSDDNAVHIRGRDIPLVQVYDAFDRRRKGSELAMLINFRAPAVLNGDRPYKSYEARHLLVSEDQLLSGDKPLVDPAEFKDKIVFVGLTASGLVDVFQTPFGSEGTMPGIQLHATITDSVLQRLFIRQASEWTAVAATLAGAVLIGLAASLLPFAGSLLTALVLASGWAYIGVRAFRGGLWLPLIEPLVGVAVALFAGTAYQYFVEDREKRKVKRLFGRYVSKDVYEQLLQDPARAELGGSRREMTVLFSDIRGFTSVTEKGDPEELVAQLNEYFSRMVAIVFRHSGTVDKFVGDMVMALFGAPLDDTEHAEHAVRAAVDMVKELGELNREWTAAGKAQLDIGIGVNSGEMIAGNIGSSSIMSYTVIGDNVNLGSRLESLNKNYNSRIIISDATRVRLKGAYDLQPLGDVVVKGKTRPVAIFEVKVPSPLPTAPEVTKL